MANFKSNKTSKAAPAPAPAPAAKPAKALAACGAAKALARSSYEPTQEEIQTRAFEIYVSEGCKEGNDLEYWLRAEQELRAR